MEGGKVGEVGEGKGKITRKRIYGEIKLGQSREGTDLGWDWTTDYVVTEIEGYKVWQ